MFAFADRSKNIEKLKSEHFDLVIIGGGITGAGVARDAASRGMKVAIIDANDFAFGTSSRSSKLIHGGIRYLENFEFHLVYEALSERKVLFEIAPHLVHPLRFLIPLFDGDRVGMGRMGVGMWAYEALSLFEAPQLHERLSKNRTLERISILKPEGLKGSYVYSDAYMDDDRLVMETLRSAVKQGAVAVSFAKATGARMSNGKVVGLECIDVIGQNTFAISGKHFVSTVGPWTDIVGHSIFKNWKRQLRPSKGVHITLNKDRLPLDCAVVMSTDKDQKRIVFGIPRHEMIIIGTTDTDFQGDPTGVHTLKNDVDYLLAVARNYFPGANLKQEDIIASYAGVRPLVDDGSTTESKTSREHLILTDERNVTFVAGGKYTTYRRMAQQTVELCLRHFYNTEDRVRFARNQTKNPLNPLASAQALSEAQKEIPRIARHMGASEKDAQVLIERHGLEAIEIVNKYFSAGKTIWELEAQFAMDETCCGRIIDFYLRRVPLFLSQKNHGYEMLGKISKIFAQKYSWSDSEIRQQIQAAQDFEKFEMGWKN